MSGSPAFELLNRAGEWQPQLIVVGSHGHTALGRFVLGSVSQKVLTEAQASVRVARRATGAGASAERIVVGVDGSTGAQAAVRAVAARGCSLVVMVSGAAGMYAFENEITFFIGRDAEDEGAELAGARSIEALRDEIRVLRAELRALRQNDESP